MRGELLAELTGIGDVYTAIRDEDWPTARELRQRYEDCLRLLDDLGWAEEDPGEAFAITAPPDVLRRLLGWLSGRASEAIGQLREATPHEAAELRQATGAVAAYGEILAQLGEAPKR